MAGRQTRRGFLSASGTALAATLLAPFAAFGQFRIPPKVPVLPTPDARSASGQLYQRAFVLDGNSLPAFGYLCCNPKAEELLAVVRDCGINALKTTLGSFNGSFEDAVFDIADVQSLVDRHPDMFIKVARHDDLDRAQREHKMALILSFEAASMLEDKLDRIELFRELDVLVMQLTYNRRTPFGCGCLDGDTDGVTKLGHDAIEKMNALGVALDLSHANAKTTADGIAISNKPVVISHAGCRGVFDHPRNKDDRVMKALADKGGVMGIYMLPFLTEDTRQPMLADYMRHMKHAIKVLGEDHVGIGTDAPFFPYTDEDIRQQQKYTEERAKAGMAAPGENRPYFIPDVNTPLKLELVADAMLRQGISERVTEKVLGQNFQRVFKDIWTA